MERADRRDAVRQGTRVGLFWGVLLLLVLPIQCHHQVWAEEDTAFLNVTVTKVYDGDTLTVTLSPTLPPVFGEKIGIRVRGIDTPEIRGACPQEKALALKARDIARAELANATQVDLVSVSRGKYFRLVATVLVDGRSLAERLIQEGLAVPYDGGTKTHDWCATDQAPGVLCGMGGGTHP